MKIKTYRLSGAALDWAVAKCEGLMLGQIAIDGVKQGFYNPSTDWSLAGPIIEREGIEVLCNLTLAQAKAFKEANPDWFACRKQRRADHFHGTSPLIAAMRCYVASKLGDEIDIPEELR